MKVRVDKHGKQSRIVEDAEQVHVSEDRTTYEVPTAEYCYARAAEELRSKNHPTSMYAGTGMSSIMYIPDHAAARLWIELGSAIADLYVVDDDE